MDQINKARMFAVAAHKSLGHVRKYSGECYTAHLEEVARLVETHGGSNDMICAAWLHDIVEDTEITIEEIGFWFGVNVANLVYWLTDVSKPEDGNRKTRKALDRDHLALAPAEAQTIKLCDLISNTSSIVENDPKFAVTYLAEKRELLGALTKGNPKLHSIASQHANAATI